MAHLHLAHFLLLKVSNVVVCNGRMKLVQVLHALSVPLQSAWLGSHTRAICTHFLLAHRTMRSLGYGMHSMMRRAPVGLLTGDCCRHPTITCSLHDQVRLLWSGGLLYLLPPNASTACFLFTDFLPMPSVAERLCPCDSVGQAPGLLFLCSTGHLTLNKEKEFVVHRYWLSTQSGMHWKVRPYALSVCVLGARCLCTNCMPPGFGDVVPLDLSSLEHF